MTSTGPRDYWPEGFAEFWMLYPKHVAKLDAWKAWRQVHPTPDDIAAIKRALDWQMQQPSWQNGFVPHPGTYLRGRRWEDEPFATPAEPTCNGTAATWVHDVWVPLYAHYRHHAVYCVTQRDVPIVARLLKAHDADRLRRLARVFLNSDDDWIEATDRGLGAFASRINWCENRLRQFEAEREER